MTNVCQSDIIARPLTTAVRPSAAFTASAEQRIPRPPRQPQATMTKAPGTSTTPIERSQTPRVVLVANEEPTARKTLKQLLESANFYVIEADNGRAALGQLSDEVDVVMATLSLPDVSGRDCLRHIRQHYSDIPVILISRMGDIPEALAVMREGAFECFYAVLPPGPADCPCPPGVRIVPFGQRQPPFAQCGHQSGFSGGVCGPVVHHANLGPTARHLCPAGFERDDHRFARHWKNHGRALDTRAQFTLSAAVCGNSLRFASSRHDRGQAVRPVEQWGR